MPIKLYLGAIASLIAAVAYVIYFWQIISGKVKPHTISWFIWGVLTTIVFAAQMVKHGGAGAYVTGMTGAACFAIAIVAFFKAKIVVDKIDKVFLISAAASLCLWWITNEPLLSVILITITDACAFVMVFKKSYKNPFEEGAALFGLSAIKFFISIFALESYSVTTWLYPVYLVIGNGALAIMILVRRHYIKN